MVVADGAGVIFAVIFVIFAIICRAFERAYDHAKNAVFCRAGLAIMAFAATVGTATAIIYTLVTV
jgi:hypothetical protein